AQEFGRAVAGGADEMKVPRMPLGRFEPRAPFAEVDFARDAARTHPLERAVHRGAADPGRLAMDEVHELVGADVSLLTKEHVNDAISFAGFLSRQRTIDRSRRSRSRSGS